MCPVGLLAILCPHLAQAKKKRAFVVGVKSICQERRLSVGSSGVLVSAVVFCSFLPCFLFFTYLHLLESSHCHFPPLFLYECVDGNACTTSACVRGFFVLILHLCSYFSDCTDAAMPILTATTPVALCPTSLSVAYLCVVEKRKAE